MNICCKIAYVKVSSDRSSRQIVIPHQKKDGVVEMKKITSVKIKPIKTSPNFLLFLCIKLTIIMQNLWVFWQVTIVTFLMMGMNMMKKRYLLKYFEHRMVIVLILLHYIKPWSHAYTLNIRQFRALRSPSLVDIVLQITAV